METYSRFNTSEYYRANKELNDIDYSIYLFMTREILGKNNTKNMRRVNLKDDFLNLLPFKICKSRL